MQLISCLPIPLVLPAILWQVHTLQVSIFLPNTTIHQLLSKWTQAPEKPLPIPSRLTTSLNQLGRQILASWQMKSRQLQFWVPPKTVGWQHGAHSRPCIGFSHPDASAMLCHFQMHTWEPNPIFSSPNQCPAMCTIAQEPRHKVEGRGKDETKGQFFFQIPSTPVHLPSYQEPMDHQVSPA